jgi:methylated-DNA-[protein]-cysteine S-methyltransferase
MSAPRVHCGCMTAFEPPTSYGYAATPLGRVLVVSTETEVIGLYFDAHERTPEVPDGGARESAPLTVITAQLDEYFSGARTTFDVPLRLDGTPFQRAVWSALLQIPYGSTSTYAQIAMQLGNPRATRAVGAANGRNPISIVIPCHRLVGAGGALTGYGWGLDRKRRLLELEGAVEPEVSSGSG